MADFSIIILSYNEEQHLPRLFNSLSGLNAPLYVLDSGSTDNTLKICHKYGAQVAFSAFVNHPLQWDAALKIFDIQTPWIIGLDSDQSLSPDLFKLLDGFRDSDYQGITGIYFNRKYLFKGSWIRHGGHYPFYQLKMFRKDVGYSDLNENMDHRFVASGKSIIWRKGHLIEENLKENEISFWIDKHNRYSDLIAVEEVERMQSLRSQTLKPDISGNPDERRALKKSIWWKLPRYLRPFLYFTWRMIFQLGILDGRNGILYHYLHAFWFRLIVDIKIGELLKKVKQNESNSAKKEI